MLALDLIKLIIADFKKRKFSTFLTFFSISLGILAVFVIILVSIGFESSIVKQFDSLGANRIYVMNSNSNFGTNLQNKKFSDFEIDLIKRQSYILEVHPYFYKNLQLKFSNQFKLKQVIGTNLNENYFSDLNFDIELGRFPSQKEKYSLVVGPAFAKDYFDKEILVGSNIYIGDTKFKVVGILKSIGNPQDDKNVYANINTIRDITNSGNSVGVADVIVQKGGDIVLAGDNIKNLLERRLGKDTITIMTPDQILDQLSSILNIVKYTLGGIAFVALIVGALGIINTMFVIVTEKIRDIGIMKAIGATNFQILYLFTFQSGLFGFFGALIGVIFGSGIAKVFEQVAVGAGYSFLTISIEPLIVIYLLVFGFVIGIIAGFIPSYKASKISIVEAIRKWFLYLIFLN